MDEPYGNGNHLKGADYKPSERRTMKRKQPQAKLMIKRFRHAIEWALGVRGNFKQRRMGDGPFWWRKELQKRAGLK